jgi:mRNA-degrading endonuclease RelE of RelBE toxin-antitoxin system
MAWAVELSASAEKDLKPLPRDRQARIAHAIDEMEANPLVGDVKALQGPEWKGRYRKRVGPYGLSSAWITKLRPWRSPPFSSVPANPTDKLR